MRQIRTTLYLCVYVRVCVCVCVRERERERAATDALLVVDGLVLSIIAGRERGAGRGKHI